MRRRRYRSRRGTSRRVFGRRGRAGRRSRVRRIGYRM